MQGSQKLGFLLHNTLGFGAHLARRRDGADRERLSVDLVTAREVVATGGAANDAVLGARGDEPAVRALQLALINKDLGLDLVTDWQPVRQAAA